MSSIITKCNYLVRTRRPGRRAAGLRRRRSAAPAPVRGGHRQNVTAAEAVQASPRPARQPRPAGPSPPGQPISNSRPDGGHSDPAGSREGPGPGTGGRRGHPRSRAVPQFRTFIERLQRSVPHHHGRHAAAIGCTAPTVCGSASNLASDQCDRHRRRLPLLRPGGHRPRHLRTQRRRPRRHRAGRRSTERPYLPSATPAGCWACSTRSSGILEWKAWVFSHPEVPSEDDVLHPTDSETIRTSRRRGRCRGHRAGVR